MNDGPAVLRLFISPAYLEALWATTATAGKSGRAIEEALERADELERQEDDRDLDAEAKRIEAAMKKARVKNDEPKP